MIFEILGEEMSENYLTQMRVFCEMMKKKLREREERYGDVTRYSVGQLRLHLCRELSEWFDAIGKENEKEELLDVAGLCYLIWRVLPDRQKRGVELEEGGQAGR